MGIYVNGIEMPKEPDEMIELAIFGDGKTLKTGESWRSPVDGKCYYGTSEDMNTYYAEELSNQQWIKFITRPLTEEEKEEHPEWACILDCKLPDDGQDILVSNGRWVTVDTFFSDDGCYLDSNGDLEGLWWMRLPEPPKEGKQ